VRLAPGTTLWLLHHELRLSWRGLLQRRSRGGRGGGRFGQLWLMLILPLILLVTAGMPLGLALRHANVPIIPAAGLIAAAATVMIFTLMLSQTLAAAVEALYERADLDLLFSSPIPPRRVMTVRFLAVAATVFALYGIITTPILLPIAVLGHPTWLAAEVVLFTVALTATGVGLLVAAALLRLIGPRRTRTIGQVLAAVIGAAFFLIVQARNILGGAQTANVWATVMRIGQDPRFHGFPGLDWPLRALIGEPLPLGGMVAAGVGVFLLANQLLGARFAADAAAAAGAGAGGRKAKVSGRISFAAGAFQATVRKELRLLVRDPALITQVLLRVLYMIPLGFLLLRRASEGQSVLLPGSAAALAFMSGQVAGSLAWITISAEDAPDLLVCAPAPTSLVRRGKLAAAGLPVMALLTPILLPLAVMAPLTALAAAVGCAASIVMAGLMNVWWQRPGKRSEFRRRRQSSWLVTLAELLLGLLIASATGLFAAGILWGLLPAVLALVGVLMLSRTDAQIAQALRNAA
jgi:ABC-2 type transport system permease protein